MGGTGGGGTRNDTDPYDNGTETPLLLSQRSVSEEPGRVDGGPVDLLSLDQVTDLGTNSVPDAVERGVKDSMD